MRGRRVPAREHAAVLVRRSDQDTWTPDVTVRIKIDRRWTTTDHPVEQGAKVSDHSQEQPDTIVISCILDENLPSPQQGGRTHLRRMVKWLEETGDAAEVIDIRTRRLGLFRGYVLTAAPMPIDNVSRLELELELREVRIATATIVQISVETVTDDVATGAPDEVDAGEQGTETTEDDAAAEESDSSILYELLYGEDEPEEEAA